MPLLEKVAKKYKSKNVVVETGTFRGDGVQNYLNWGFQKVVSFEIQPDLFHAASKRFQNNPQVSLYLGDSALALKELLAGSSLTEPAIFFLDAHCSAGETGASELFDEEQVLRNEMLAIKNHSVKNHTILIDDMRGFQKANIEKIVKDIFPDYLISYEDGHQKKDVLAAYPAHEFLQLKLRGAALLPVRVFKAIKRRL